MKPMTESEARAALKAEMPWAKYIDTRCVPTLKATRWSIVAYARKDGPVVPSVSNGNLGIAGYAPTLRAAVAKAIKAWRATQPKPAKRSALARKWERIGKAAGGTKSFSAWKKGAKR